jgi:RNA polymerase sigma-70 factor (ECF subfamily)
VVRPELCHQAIRLVQLLVAHPVAGTPRTRALLALLCLNAARLPARVDENGELVLLEDQDRSRWDAQLIAAGLTHLNDATQPGPLSELHLEAAIAAEHASAPSFAATNWSTIRALYDALLALRPSPVVALNRAIAVGRAQGPDAGLAALDAIDGRERLEEYPYYWAARADCHERAARRDAARADFEHALAVAATPSQRQQLTRRLARLG